MLHKVADLSDLWIGEMRAFCINGQPILLIRSEDGVVAFEDRCAHAGVRISEGRLVDGVLTCRAHEWQFDARTGCGVNPQKARLRQLAVHIEEDAVHVDLPVRDSTNC